RRPRALGRRGSVDVFRCESDDCPVVVFELSGPAPGRANAETPRRRGVYRLTLDVWRFCQGLVPRDHMADPDLLVCIADQVPHCPRDVGWLAGWDAASCDLFELPAKHAVLAEFDEKGV